MTDEFDALDAFLDAAYEGQERLSSLDLQRRAIAEDLPATLLIRVGALPEGEYAQDEAAETIRLVQV
jgi:hypothetical protein